MMDAPLVLLAAGGTGGHMCPAEALGAVLMKRGYRVRLVTDDRAVRYSGLVSRDMIDVVPSETVRGRNPLSLARTAAMLSAGAAKAALLIRRLKPAVVVGFGGYPTLPPLMAAKMLGVPPLIHDSNAVLGRANRLLSSRVNAIATSLPGVLDRDPALASKATTTGTPMRSNILAAAAVPFAPLAMTGPFRLQEVGGRLGALVMGDFVPGDYDQFANAGVPVDAGGAIRIPQPEFTPSRLAAEISALAAEPSRLTEMAAGARNAGKLDAADRLADLVVKVAGI